MYPDRLPYYKELEQARNSKLLVYVTGDRAGMEAQIGDDVWDSFVWHLDRIGTVKRISLYLYTKGGLTLVAWSLVNLIRQFCDELEVIVPSKALSAGTLICLGANRILMTRQATLGSIDPSVDNPLNPEAEELPGGEGRVPVSVEDIEGFIEHARKTLGDKGDLTEIYARLVDKIHPLVLGNAYRVRGQIRMVGHRLISLSGQIQETASVDRLVDFLCGESGSHDYTINRIEARDMGLMVEFPDNALYTKIKIIYDDIAKQMILSSPFDKYSELGDRPNASFRLDRAIIESVPGGSHVLIHEARLARVRVNTPSGPQDDVQDYGRDDWKHEYQGEELHEATAQN